MQYAETVFHDLGLDKISQTRLSTYGCLQLPSLDFPRLAEEVVKGKNHGPSPHISILDILLYLSYEGIFQDNHDR